MICKALVIAIVLLESYLVAEGYYGFPVAAEPTNEESLESCGVKITKVGCYNDHLHTPRPLPKLMLTDRDPKSPAWDGHMFDWENPAKSMRSLACRCAKKVLSMGYSHFSLQYYGECWSGKNADTTFSNDGPSNQCVDGSLRNLCDKRPHVPCAGEGRSNYVYIASEKSALPTTPAPPCKDQYPERCEYFANLNFCTKDYQQVLDYCPKSCKLC